MSITTTTVRTAAHLARALAVTPNASQTRSKAPGKVGTRDTATAFPLFQARGAGAYVYDLAGRPYLDLFGANAAVPLGHAFGPVVRAVEQAVRDGSLGSLPHEREAEVSERFLRVCARWAEQVRWVKTGSEATHAALKIAKRETGRDYALIGTWAYHGWHEWCADEHSTDVFRYDWGETLADCAGANVNADRIAAVFVEPHRWEAPPEGWLASVRRYCDAIGALLVFDEMVYGLRWAHGGGSEYYGVTPDLACFGKALGNGVPVACVCGPERFMRHATMAVSGTYGGEMLGLAAAEAVLRTYDAEPIIQRLWQNGRRLWERFGELAPADARLDGTAVHWRLLMPDAEALDRALLAAAGRGLLLHRDSNNASAAMLASEATWAGEQLAYAAQEALR